MTKIILPVEVSEEILEELERDGWIKVCLEKTKEGIRAEKLRQIEP